MNIAHHTISRLAIAQRCLSSIANWVRSHLSISLIRHRLSHLLESLQLKLQLTPLQPLRQWLNQTKVTNPKLAELVCHLIPAQCPFAREIRFHGKLLFEIPPMCKINPLYEELMYLRFRAMCYLADECGS